MTASAFKNKVYPSLIQGVSQQARQQRRDSQCEEQINCINSIVSGSEARSGGNLVASLPGINLTDAFFYRIRRGADEQYIVTIKGGDLKVYNLLTGVECAVSFPDGKSYLTLPGGVTSEDSFSAISIQDATIIANKTVTLAMGSTLSTVRPREACFYFKAGAYSTTYTVSLRYNSVTYVWRYRTPDNSTAPNATFIATDQLAATFYRAMSGGAATGAPTDGGIIGGAHDGDTTASRIVSPGTLPAGFNIALDGNVVRLWRTDGVDFRLSVSDGQGGRQLIGFEDSIESFSDLPKSCFSGYIVKVSGQDKSEDDDYFVRFAGNTGSDGVWQETLAPGIKTGLDATTMPHTLQNTAPNTFVFKRTTWGSRVSGDGVTTSPEPSFIGQEIRELFYDRNRLGILTEANLVWSRAKQPFVFFPDTAQTTLATDPVDQDISYKDIVLLRRFVAASSTRMAWADGVQFTLTTNDQTFKQETSEAIPASNYEFSDRVAPLPVGQLLFFALDHGSFTSIKDIIIDRERVASDNTTTAHVPRYLPGGPRHIAGSDALNMLFVHCAERPVSLWLYQWLFTDEGRVQAAWSEWRFPTGSSVLWAGFTSSTLHILVQRASGVILEEHDLSYLGRDAEQPVRLRLDHAVGAAKITGLSYNASTDRTTFTMPYSLTGVPLGDLTCILEADYGDDYRGKTYDLVTVSGTTVVVKGDLTGRVFRVGFKITSSRTFTEFFDKQQNGDPYAAESIILDRITVFHGVSGYYRVQVVTNTSVRSYAYEGRRLGEASMATPGLATAEGSFTAPIQADSKETKIALINDSPYPSAWSAAEWFYQVQRSE